MPALIPQLRIEPLPRARSPAASRSSSRAGELGDLAMETATLAGDTIREESLPLSLRNCHGRRTFSAAPDPSMRAHDNHRYGIRDSTMHC